MNDEATMRVNASWYHPADTLGRGLAVAYGVFTPHPMRVIAVIDQCAVIENILRHLGLWKVKS